MQYFYLCRTDEMMTTDVCDGFSRRGRSECSRSGRRSDIEDLPSASSTILIARHGGVHKTISQRQTSDPRCLLLPSVLHSLV
jgi:hypothetical protein